MSTKASGMNPKRSRIGTKWRLFCLSLFTCVLLGACSDAKGLVPVPQNDTLYALPAGVNAEVNESFQLGAQRVKGGTAINVSDKVSWASSDESVVKVDASGKATASGIGVATVTTTFEGFTASVNVKVSGRIMSAEVEAGAISLAKGTSYKLATIGIVEDWSKRALPSSQAWGSNDTSVATVSSDGTVTAKAAGQAVITLTFKGVSYERNVTVVDAPLDSVAITSDNGLAVPVGMRTTFRVVGTFGGGAFTQNITNLFAASVSTEDSEFATVSATAVTARGLPAGTKATTVLATIAGAKGSIAERFTEDVPIAILDAKSLTSLAIAGVPAMVPANGEPFTPTFKGTYGDGPEINTTAPTLSFTGATSGDKTQYVEIITGAVYPRIAGTVSIVGTVSIAADGPNPARTVTASADTQIVDAALAGVTLASAEMMQTTTVNVGKTIRLSATAEYGAVTQTVTSAVVWVSADPTIAIVSNATGTFGGAGRVTGVSAGGPVDIQAYYRGKLVGAIKITVVP